MLSRIVPRLAALLALAMAPAALAGSIFLTGHDPDFHAAAGGNRAGALNINRAAIDFVMDPGFNPFVSAAPRFLFVESRIAAPEGHGPGKLGMLASGYLEGVHFDHHDAATLDAALDRLGSAYSAIVVASDFGGLLTQAELDILNARARDIVAFLDAGGGLYAMAQSNGGAGLTPKGGHYAFLPYAVEAEALHRSEIGNRTTPLGAGLGLAEGDVNGNAAHAVFTDTGGMEAVDEDSAGNALGLAARSPPGVPAPK